MEGPKSILGGSKSTQGGFKIDPGTLWGGLGESLGPLFATRGLLGHFWRPPGALLGPPEALGEAPKTLREAPGTAQEPKMTSFRVILGYIVGSFWHSKIVIEERKRKK